MAASTGNRAAGPLNDDFTLMLCLAVVAIGLAFFGWLSWTTYHGAISAVAADVLESQIQIIHRFTPALDSLHQTIASANFDTVTISDILTVANLTGDYLRVPVIAFILLLAALCFTRAAPSRFTRKLDLEGLIREHTLYFRAIAAFTRRNLRLVSLRPDVLRPCDPALHTRDWVLRFANTARDRRGSAVPVLDERAAVEAFTAQLGPVWRGVEHAPGHVRVLYAAFGSHLDQRRSEAQDLLSALSEALPAGGSSDSAGPEMAYEVPASVIARADDALDATEVFEQAKQIASRHAYTAPALMSVLTAARRRAGVLAPAQFACLKLIDRSLWYALHSLGFEGDGPGQHIHPNPRIEAAGARDHWATERMAGKPFIIPSVSRAVSAVRATLEQDERNARSQEDTL
jgi:intracellular multiplication protein IcmP